MSYARQAAMSDAFENICRAIRMSERYKGYSIYAGEILFMAVQCCPEVKIPPKRKNSIDLLRENFPADYWRVMKDAAGLSQKTIHRRALNCLKYLREVNQKKFITFQGKRFQVGSLKTGMNYVMSKIPKKRWLSVPFAAKVYHDLIMNDGTAEYFYDEGSVKFEVVNG